MFTVCTVCLLLVEAMLTLKLYKMASEQEGAEFFFNWIASLQYLKNVELVGCSCVDVKFHVQLLSQGHGLLNIRKMCKEHC